MEKTLSPKRPYLLRAYYDWLLDNELTPFFVVDAEYFGVDVPREYVKDGQIILNLSPIATGNFILNNKEIQFSARFSGVSRNICVPMGAAVAIYARESGDGVMFEPEAIYEQAEDEQPLSFVDAVDKPKTKTKEKKSKAASHLQLIK